MNPDLNEVLERGDAAEGLLQSDTFTSVMNDLSNFHVSAMTACHPTERDREARDYHHLMLHALREIVDELRSRIAAAQEIEDRLGLASEETA